MKLVLRKLDLEGTDHLESLVAENIDGIEPGLRVVDSRVLLGHATIDIVATDADGAPVMFVVNRIAEAFQRKLKQLNFTAVDCVEFRHFDVNGVPAVYFETVANVRRGAAPVVSSGPVPTAKGRSSRRDAPEGVSGGAEPRKIRFIDVPSGPTRAAEPAPVAAALIHTNGNGRHGEAAHKAAKIIAIPEPTPTIVATAPAAVRELTPAPVIPMIAAPPAVAREPDPLPVTRVIAAPVAPAPIAIAPIEPEEEVVETVEPVAPEPIEIDPVEPIAAVPDEPILTLEIEERPLPFVAPEPAAVAPIAAPIAAAPEPVAAVAEAPVTASPEPIAIAPQPALVQPKPVAPATAPVIAEPVIAAPAAAAIPVAMEPLRLGLAAVLNSQPVAPGPKPVTPKSVTPKSVTPKSVTPAPAAAASAAPARPATPGEAAAETGEDGGKPTDEVERTRFLFSQAIKGSAGQEIGGLQLPKDGTLTRQWIEFLNQLSAK
jgi:hypothetical protein